MTDVATKHLEDTRPQVQAKLPHLRFILGNTHVW
ncbi:hypothethical protein [Ralstonia solanacearum PSI07]|nr:hypothethical protein [Ralstonia solanacearum PSI07]